MQEFTSTSDPARVRNSLLAALVSPLLGLAFLGLGPADARAGPPAAEAAQPPAGGKEKENKSLQPEDEDFSTTPYTEYGEFNEEEDEAVDTKFFQYGRFFGVSLGGGFHGVTGNRGQLWRGGFPTVELKAHYWFDFNFALDLGVFRAGHFYDLTSTEVVDVSMLFVGVSVRYYIDTKNLSSAVSFANPFALIGAGAYTKTESNQTQGTTDAETSFTINGGGGVEFALKHRKVYLQLEGRAYYARFNDTSSRDFKTSLGLQDLTGIFYTFGAKVLFTW